MKCFLTICRSSDDGTCRIWDARNAEIRPRIYVPRPPDSVAGLYLFMYYFDSSCSMDFT